MPRHPESPDPKTTTATKRATSNGVLAGRLYERIKELSAQEDAEIKSAPASIHERFAAKRRKLVSAAGAKNPEVASLVMNWLALEAAQAEAAKKGAAE